MGVELNSAEWQQFSLFESIEEPMIRKFLSIGFHFRYEAGALIVANNDLGETFFLLIKGLAKLVLKNSQGEFLNVNLFQGGDFFGELSLLEPGSVRNGNIVAITEVEVAAIQKKDFLKIMLECPMLSFNLARCLGRRLRTMNERVMTDRMPDDFHKVAHTFLVLVNKGKTFHKDGPVLLPPLSLKEWALFCYTSADLFIESIERLKQLGALDWQNQRIVITNLDQLKMAAQVHQNRIGAVTAQSSTPEAQP